MNKRSRILCMLMMLLMLFALIPQKTSAMSVTTPRQSVTSTEYFTALPGVYEMGDGYAVIWATNFKGTGYIQYTYQGKTYTVYDMKNGIVRTGDTIHVVKVPHEHLLGNSYTVYSRQVTSHSGVYTNYGTTISAGPITLKAYDGGVDDFDVLVLTDVHGQLNWAKTVAGQFAEEPDIVVFSGDIEDSLETKAAIVKMFNIMGSVTGGRYPAVYCRGNHETRGAYSTTLLEYFPTETGEFYFDFRYGPLWGVVMDTGEDKDDASVEYGNLANYKEYNLKQEAWLRSLRMDESATFRFGIYHMPRLHDLTADVDFTDSIGHLGLQFGVTGHLHSAQIYDKVTNKGTSIRHDGFIAGGYEIDAATMVTLKNSTKQAYVTVKKQNGSIYGGYNRKAFALCDYVGSVPAPMAEPERGLNAQFNPSAASKGSISITVPPTVFETGGDWYNVVWTTSTTNSDAKGMTGYVEYEYGGKTYQVFDEVAGYRRSYDEIHTVRVPKEHLNNNSYRVGSFLVHYAYKFPNNVGRYYVPGDWVESKTYVFEDRSGDKAISLIACSDIKMNGTNTAMLTAVQNSVAALGTSPAYILVNGDAVNNELNSTRDYINLFTATSAVSGGIHPVIFSRGNAECRGYYAPNLLKYIPTATGEYYYSVTAGEYTIVNLDMAEDKKDSDSKFGGRVFLDAVRQKQIPWINSLPEGKLVAVGHMAAASAITRFGLDFETPLMAKGAILSIGGHDTNHGLYYKTGNADGYHIYTIIPGGWNGSGNVSVSVLLADELAHIKACQYANGTVTNPTNKVVSLADGKNVAYSAVRPLKLNGVYQISEPGHIKWLSQNCTGTNSFAGETFRLVNDIDMMLVPHTPIGGNDSVYNDSNSTSRGFAGTFDGSGYTIHNLNIVSSSNNVGFFGVVRNGTVKALTISGGMVDAGSYVGGLAGFATGATFSDCYCDVTTCSGNGSKVGGVFGFLTGGTTVERCANFGHVSTGQSVNLSGGVVGQIHSHTPVTVRDSFNRGNITNQSASGVAGGLYGYSGAVPAQVINCYNASDVACPGSQGAIVGGYASEGSMSVKNTWFAAGYNGAATAFNQNNAWRSSAGSGTVASRTQSAMRSRDMAQTLNGDVFLYVPSVNDGYPVHTSRFHPSGSPQHSYIAVVTAPTCTEGGYTTYTCSCGDSYVADETPAAGHHYSDGVCTGCGSADPEYIDPSVPYSLVGDMNGWNEQTHAMEGDGKVSITVTLEPGSYRFKIRRSYMEFGNESVIVNGTATGCPMTTEAGYCTLQASGGTYCFTFDPATCLLEIIYLSNETEDAPITNGTITLKSMTLSLEDEIVYNLYFETENIPVGEESLGMIIWDREPVLPTINGGGTVIAGATYLPASDQYGITSMGIPAKNMGDMKYMVVYARLDDGTYVYSRVLQYSARTYCMNRVQKSGDENMRALCVALMNYGAEAQKYFAATTDYTYTELMNAGFEEYQYLVQPYSRDLLNLPGTVDAVKAGEFGTTANGFTQRSASMSADGSFALNYYFTTAVPVEKVTMYYWTAEQYAAAAVLTPENASGSKEMVPLEVVNQFWANYDGIAAKEMDVPLYVCGVYEAEGEVYSTGVIAYSMARYCTGKAENNSEIQNFARAMAVYGYHAKTYFQR